jgi:cysteine desulfurase family protein (TIGR01976 family)
MTYDLPLAPAAIRTHFPAFAEPTLEGWGFFENAGGSYTSQQALTRLNDYYTRTKLQPYGAYPASRAAGEAMDLAYERLAAALNVSVEAIHIGPSTSANTYALAHAFAAFLSPGDTIVVTDQDHEANSGVWRKLETSGFTIRQWHADPQTGHLNPADLDALIDNSVKLVAFTHCSNIVGEINPVKAICAKLAAQGILTCVDGVSYAPHGLPDLTDLGPDIYMFSAYKTFGPHQGVMVVKPELAAQLPNQGHFFNESQPRKRLVPAGPDHAQIAACTGIADYLEALGTLAPDTSQPDLFRRAETLIHAQEKALVAPLLDYLRTRSDIRLIGPDTPEGRAPTIALALAEPGMEVAKRLANHKVMVGGGHFYAWRLLERLGIDPQHGVLRLSLVHYNTPEEVTRLIGALDAEL